MTTLTEKIKFIVLIFTLYGLGVLGTKLSENHKKETGNYMMVKAASGNLSYNYFYFGAKSLNSTQNKKPKSLF